MLTTRRRQTGAENESVNVSQTSGETFAGKIFCTGLLHTLPATVHVSHFLLWRSAFPRETFFFLLIFKSYLLIWIVIKAHKDI